MPNPAPAPPDLPRATCATACRIAALALVLLGLLTADAFAARESRDGEPTTADETPVTEQALAAAGAGRIGVAVEILKGHLATEPDDAESRFLLAGFLAALGDWDGAGPHFHALVEADPTNGVARVGEATALLMRESWTRVRERLEEGLRVLPRDGRLAHFLARVAASAPDEAARDGRLALRLALEVWEVRQERATAETVAMAYAEAGHLDDAVAMQKSVLSRLAEEGEAYAAVLDLARERLRNYEEGRAWRAKSPAEIARDIDSPRPAGGAAETDS